MAVAPWWGAEKRRRVVEDGYGWSGERMICGTHHMKILILKSLLVYS
jgi:hypothetical protein